MWLTKPKYRPKQNRSLLMSAFVPVVTVILLLCGCFRQQPVSLDEPLTLYRENKLEQALPLFKRVVAQNTNNAEAHSWLAETYRRLGMKDKAVKTAVRALELDSCNSFAHTVIADACHRMPGDGELLNLDTTWVHINKAIQCDSTDGNAWVSICCEAMLRGKFDLMRRSARKMKETGFLTEVVLAYGRWMMRTLPENAILITNGDMDTYPLLALQSAEDFRTDVAVVEKEWLGLKQYLRFLRVHYGVPLSLTDSQIDSLTECKEFPENILFISDQIFKGCLEQKANGSFERPIAIAVTVENNFYSGVKDYFQYAGPFLLWQPTPVDDTPDTTALGASLAGIRPEDFIGPWVSTQDRSPIRRLYTKYIVKNVTESAIVFSQELIKAKRLKETMKILNWVEEFEKLTELGPVYTEQIARLKEAVKDQKQ